MKKSLLVILIVLLVILTVGSSVSFAEEQVIPTADLPTDNSENPEIQAFVKELCALNAEGNKSGNKEEIRKYLVEKFRSALGEPADIATAESNVKEDYFTNDGNAYWNIVARLVKDDTAKQIVIGAHYDVTNGEGAADNVVGVAVLYQTIKTLVANASIPCNITFVAFDGEENGLLGSKHFVSKMSAEQLLNTLVMFNIDSIALGDNVYLMCENKRTDLANTILANSEGIVEKPYAKGTYGSYLEGVFGFGYGYYEYIQGSDHTPFRLSGIPIAFLFSGTYSAEIWKFSESSDPSKKVINSAADTYDNLVSSGVDYLARINTVSSAITQTITSDGFTEVAENAKSQLVNLNFWYNKWWASLAILVILVILAVLTWFYNNKLQKKAILGTAEIKTQKVFEKPDASEIFSFDDKDSQSKADVDDIFTFKK